MPYVISYISFEDKKRKILKEHKTKKIIKFDKRKDAEKFIRKLHPLVRRISKPKIVKVK